MNRDDRRRTFDAAAHDHEARYRARLDRDPETPRIGRMALWAGLLGLGLLGTVLFLAVLVHVADTRQDRADGAGLRLSVSTSTSNAVAATPVPRHRPGDCLAFGDLEAVAVETFVQGTPVVVPCDQPHQVQVAGWFDLSTLGDLVTHAQIEEAVGAACATAEAGLLGAPRDPVGRYQQWFDERDADALERGRGGFTCGLVTVEVGRAEGFDSVLTTSQPVDGAEQQARYALGTCFEEAMVFVGCDAPHAWEVAGSFELDAATDIPAFVDHPKWEGLAAPTCKQLAATYSGRSPDAPDSGYSWMSISRDTWAAGGRHVHCLVGRWDPATERVVPVSGSLVSSPT